MNMTYEEYKQKIWDLCMEWGTAKAYPDGLKEAIEYFEDDIKECYENGILPEETGMIYAIILCIE